ncbi:2-hydroxyacid dehydrogenase [Streptomyces sp. L7]|uniref:2-hydroxyacid dehydrogenase n=1 Tax=Streptomyces sp. L7 TaxID=3423954 RepID=UPI003D998FFB
MTFTVSIPDGTLVAALAATGAVPPDVEVIEWDLAAPPPRARIDLVVAPYMGDWLGRLAAVAAVRPRLVQGQMLGYDGVAGVLPPGVRYANAATVHESSTAELALGLILASQRGLDDFVRQSEVGQPIERRYPSLADRHVLLLGAGGVGRAIAARLAPFEVRLTRFARTGRRDELGDVHPISELAKLLHGAEIVILALPLTAETTGLVDDAFLESLPDDALLVNVARGAVVDTEALIRATASGRLRAALDVTEPEPLPAGHPLLALPNVIVAPHVGGNSTAMAPRMARLVLEQIERLGAGAEPLHVVIGL